MNIPDPETPVGARGIGEPPVGGGCASITNAIADAIGDDMFRRAPVTLDNVLTSLEAGHPVTEPLTGHIVATARHEITKTRVVFVISCFRGCSFRRSSYVVSGFSRTTSGRLFAGAHAVPDSFDPTHTPEGNMLTRAVGFATGATLLVAAFRRRPPRRARTRGSSPRPGRRTGRRSALLKERADVNSRAADGSTALHWAAHWSDVDLLDLLLKARADVDAVNDHGVTPLILACENGSPAAVQRLLAAGAAVNRAQANGLTPLITAARTGNLEVIKALLARGADVNAAIGETGQTALMWATAEAHHDIMRTLIEGGANAHAKSKLAFTPLLFTARNGDVEAAKLLLDAGVNVNETGTDGTHALPLAIVSGNVDFALFLLDRGADANGRMGGVAALHAAAGPTEMWLRDWSRIRGVDYSRSMPSIVRAPHRAD